MMFRGGLRLASLVLLASCRFGAAARPAMVEPLPVIPVYEITPSPQGPTMAPIKPETDPLSVLGATKRVSLTASNAEARAILLWLAQEAGANLVVSPDVTARVSVNFNNVPAVEAMRAVIAEAGLSLLTSGLQAPWPPVVFYHVPVNINTATADAIVARFGVSMEMARWLVETRSKP